jgi:uncharacterized membrane protein YidH (DUF202 family)
MIAAYAQIAFFLLILAVIALVRFAVDVWRFFHASAPANAHLNYEMLFVFLILVGLAVLALLLAYLRNRKERKIWKK